MTFIALTGAGALSARLLLAGLCPAVVSIQASETDENWLEVVRAVGPEGHGNPAATRAWKCLAGQPVAAIPGILSAMDGANEIAANWLRAAIDTIKERELSAGAALPSAALGEFLLDTRHDPRARHLAFELIAQAEPAAADVLLMGMLTDPGVELRRLAVQKLIDRAEGLAGTRETNAAVLLYRQALGFARDIDQIQLISAELKKQHLVVDLPRHFGFLLSWQVIGPFDNTAKRGFATVFPPEGGVDLAAEYPGKSGPVRWRGFVTADPYGMVDINKAYGDLKGVTAYAYTEFFSDTARPAELRLGCKNGWKLWWNGQFVFGRDEYHRGMQIDQYRFPVQLQPGRNTVLVKVCQNEEIQDWTREWQFQLRICDGTGTAILSAPPPGPPGKPEEGK